MLPTTPKLSYDRLGRVDEILQHHISIKCIEIVTYPEMINDNEAGPFDGLDGVSPD
jgi:hypothetical protein